MAHVKLIYLLKNAIFYGYASVPDGICLHLTWGHVAQEK